jgi:LPS export ABC transporter protein LptC
MKTKNQVGRYLVGFLLVVGLGSLLYFSLIEPKIPGFVSKPVDRADIEFDHVKISQLDNGKVVWVIRADSADMYKDKQRTVLEGITGMYYEGLEKNVDLKAPKAEINTENSNMVFEDAVAFYYLKNRVVKLKSGQLIWINDAMQFKGSGNVELYSEGIVLKGDYFLADIPIESIQIKNNGKAQIEGGFLR